MGASQGPRPPPPILRRAAIVALLAMLPFAFAVALGAGRARLPPRVVWSALRGADAPPVARLLVRQVRLPRALGATLVGACLAVAGALMQGVTRNALASPGLLGLNAGGGLALLGASLLWPRIDEGALIVVAFAGAAFGATLALGTAALGRGRTSPVRLALAGIVVSSLLGSLTGLLVILAGMGQDLLTWTAGGLHGLRWSQVMVVLPVAAAGLVGAALIAPWISILTLGEEVAGGLGLHAGRVRGAATCVVMLLVVSALALAGPVGFVGLLVPHVVRRLVGPDYRLIVPAAALLGASVVLLADLLGRMTTFAGIEVPLGIYTALIGSLFFVVLARARGRSAWSC